MAGAGVHRTVRVDGLWVFVGLMAISRTPVTAMTWRDHVVTAIGVLVFGVHTAAAVKQVQGGRV